LVGESALLGCSAAFLKAVIRVLMDVFMMVCYSCIR
jgi:hypothetical protein